MHRKLNIYKWDVITANLGPYKNDHIIAGNRYCLVVSGYNKSDLICVIPFTTNLSNKENNPTNIYVGREEVDGYGFKDSFLLVNQLRAINKSQVKGIVGVIPNDSNIIKRIERTLLTYFDLTDGGKNNA